MSILVNSEIRVITQGMTGEAGTFFLEDCAPAKAGAQAGPLPSQGHKAVNG